MGASDEEEIVGIILLIAQEDTPLWKVKFLQWLKRNKNTTNNVLYNKYHTLRKEFSNNLYL